MFRDQLSAMAKERIEPSEIGVMIKLTIDNKAISFTAGEPSSDIFPVEELNRAFISVFDDTSLLSYYKDAFGLIELRDWIAERMLSDGMAPDWLKWDNILLTNGASEAIDLIAEALIDPGSLVLTEAPTYTESLLTFRKQGASVIGVPSDDDGIIPEELAAILSNRKARLLYTIPNFQNPSGRTSPLRRRLQILDTARSYDIPIVEDDPYHYLSYDEEPPTTYLKLAGDDRRVIHTGSFSKLVAPGVRCGWAVIPDSIIPQMSALRTSAGLSCPVFLHQGLLRYLLSIDFDNRISSLRNTYRARRNAMVCSIEKYLYPLGIRTNRPKGGFFLWGECPAVSDMVSFARFAVEKKKIGIIPGCAFFSHDEAPFNKHAFRISFAKVDPDVAEEGVRRLASAFKDYPAA